jgi:hypothetical protein
MPQTAGLDHYATLNFGRVGIAPADLVIGGNSEVHWTSTFGAGVIHLEPGEVCPIGSIGK